MPDSVEMPAPVSTTARRRAMNQFAQPVEVIGHLRTVRGLHSSVSVLIV